MAYILITGASSGLGEEFARQYAHKKRDLILVARSQDKLASLATELSKRHSVQVQVLPADLSKLDSPEKVYAACEKAGWEVDLLINNAGFGLFGHFVNQEPAKIEEMLMLNMISVSKLSRLFLPAMVRTRSGGIINVGSTASFQPIPNFAAYAATKAFVLSLSEALYAEVSASGVKVMALCPGPTETRFFDRASRESGTPGGVKIAMKSASDVVRLAINRFDRGARVVVPGFLNNTLALCVPFTPRRLVLMIGGKMMKAGSGA